MKSTTSKAKYKKYLLGLLLIFSNAIGVMGQKYFTVKIIVQNNVDKHINEDFYLTGNFVKWNVDSLKIGKIPSYKASTEIEVNHVPAGLFEYKFNRGDWHTLASTKNGRLEGPLSAVIKKDTILYATIDGWRDDFPRSTASSQVKLMDSAFFLPKLNRHKKIWIYLPKDYEKSAKKYPVLYMHDGQDLFDEATSRGRIGPLEWHVDETIDNSKSDVIVVAISAADGSKVERQNEYFVMPNPKFPEPKGAAYLHDIVFELKPFIDKNYRTLSDKKNTAIAGSSVGGLLSFYAGLMYPNTFGTLGILSPSIWLDGDNVNEIIKNSRATTAINKQNYFFYGGKNENRLKSDGTRVTMDKDIEQITDYFKKFKNPQIKIEINPNGKHGAWYWQKAFPVFFEWWQTKINQ